MVTLTVTSTILPSSLITTQLSRRPIFSRPSLTKSRKLNLTAISSVLKEETETVDQDEKFDWFSQWYAIMPACDLEKRAPVGKKVMGVDVVVWWDKNEDCWKVFDDRCPHRLAPLSQGRIDEWGRLQCVYHGWCFGGSGDCKLIPQAPLDGPLVHTFPKACVAVYPSTVQNGIVWFWPNSDPEFKDIITKKKPPYIAELDDPSFTYQMFNKDMPYGYEVLIENLMDPAHVPYAHYGIMASAPPSVKLDREGGKPLEIKVNKIDKNGFTSNPQNGQWNFVSPCLFYGSVTTFDVFPVNQSGASAEDTKEQLVQKTSSQPHVFFICIPVSSGNSRVIIISPQSSRTWMDRLIPRWKYHIDQNLVMDSDLYLLHVEEKKLMEAGEWQKACFVPTKSDANVVAFRKWLKKYAGGQVNWGNKFDGSLSPTPPKEQLMDRYWTHVVNCTSCTAAYKGFNALELSLQVISVASVAILAATKERMISGAARNMLAIAAVLCFVGSKWLSHFIYKTFHYHDYNHASH